MADRGAALEAEANAARLSEQAASEATRRQVARHALLVLIGDLNAAGEVLAPVLQDAERRVAVGQARDAAYRADHAEMRQVVDALATHARQARHRGEDRTRAEAEWLELTT